MHDASQPGCIVAASRCRIRIVCALAPRSPRWSRFCGPRPGAAQRRCRWSRSVPACGDVRRANQLHQPCPRTRGLQEPSGGRIRTGQTRLRRPVGSTTRAVRGGALRDGTHLIAAQRSKPPPGPNIGGIVPTWRLHETRGRALIAMEIYLAVGTIRVGSTQRGGAVVPRGERP